MTINNLPKTILPLEKEVEAAVQGQRELASLLSTKFETQRIDIFDKEDKPHRLVLRTASAGRYSGRIGAGQCRQGSAGSCRVDLAGGCRPA